MREDKELPQAVDYPDELEIESATWDMLRLQPGMRIDTLRVVRDENEAGDEMGVGVEITSLTLSEGRPRTRELPPEVAMTPAERWGSILRADWMLRYCVALSVFGVVGIACRKARIYRQLVATWREKCPDFAQCIREAEDDAHDAVEASLRLSATIGDLEPIYQQGVMVGTKRMKNVKAAIALMEAKRPSEWRKGDAGAQMTTNIVLQSPEAVRDAVANAMLTMPGVSVLRQASEVKEVADK